MPKTLCADFGAEAMRLAWTAGLLPLLGLHRQVPERSVLELAGAAGQVGDGVRLALFHLQGCERCTAAALVGLGEACERGARVLEAAHAWRPREAAR